MSAEKLPGPERIHRYLRREAFPHTFCRGCGHVLIMESVLLAIDELGIDIDRCVFVSGIGCAAWIPSPYINADTLHTTHGRPIAFATGVKLTNPELCVFVVSGDGDLASIGGNHLIHAARRDVDMTVICANNMIYGMTGGQLASTTPRGRFTATSPPPEGNPERAFDLSKLVAAAGASFVARYYSAHKKELVEAIKRAMNTTGFSFVEVISPCTTQYLRRNPAPEGGKPALGPHMFVHISDARKMSPQELEGKIVYGQFVPEEGVDG